MRTRIFRLTLASSLALFCPTVWGQLALDVERTASSAVATTGQLPLAMPEDVGMSSAKLQQAVARVDALIADERLAGAIVLVARHGKVVHQSVHGRMDIEADKPMREETIFRIFSMSKPIVSVAAMMLQEEGKLHLDVPSCSTFPRWRTLSSTKRAAMSHLPDSQASPTYCVIRLG